MALSLKENNFADTIIGVDNNAQHTAKALLLRLVDKTMNLEDAIAQSDIIIVAAPVDVLKFSTPPVWPKSTPG